MRHVIFLMVCLFATVTLGLALPGSIVGYLWAFASGVQFANVIRWAAGQVE